MRSLDKHITDLVEQTGFVDTHEHLIEESTRLSGKIDVRLMPCNDWAYLFAIYAKDDLAVAGMPQADLRKFLSPEVSTDCKYELVKPYWNRIKDTGYAQALRYTFRGLYGVADLTEETVHQIAEKYIETLQPGFYAAILRRAKIDYCQVNSAERIFMETAQPNILAQDLDVIDFCRCAKLDFARVNAETGKEPTTLEAWLEIVDQYFDAFGPKAVAIKCLIAYSRRLMFSPVDEARASRLFARHSTNGVNPLSSGELTALQDFLFRYCVRKATAYGLPVKLHTGYLAGSGSMQLARVRDNAADLCDLLQDFPDTQFVLMHIGYPFEKEFIALAKQYANVRIDMCWAWIISPIASVRFLKEFLLAVPANKLFTFGGDHYAVEAIYGHACIARRGIGQAISELVSEGWIERQEAPEIIEAIMRGNALRFFPNGPA
ncbi:MULTISPECIES: amidohydrolase family protein [Mesorhizobium]|uniref:amidohydrolase family protein n=1 Tax=Mesorhizobium TaxID=68287 RepID=UPI0010A962FC|nr:MULTISPECIES: amidohydrolase family protein [Mesorhizobium]